MKTHNYQIVKLNKGLTALCLSFIFCQAIAQDRIIFKNGDELNAKVMEVNDTEIKYKKPSNPDGPIRIVYKSDVFLIKYENGSKDVFNTQPKVTETVNETYFKAPITQITYQQHDIYNNKFDPDTSDFANTKRKTFAGPRVGLTYIASGTAANYLAKEGKQPLITQFGWQFEGRLFTVDHQTSGIVEFVPLIGGFEQGMFIPSANLLIGLRSGKKRSYEFALGPNFSVVPNYLGERKGFIGLVIAAGTSFKSSNINFPVNIALVPSVGSKESVRGADGLYTSQKFQTGWRLSIVIGFNSRKK